LGLPEAREILILYMWVEYRFFTWGVGKGLKGGLLKNDWFGPGDRLA
jgi:hypothetical protein